MASPIRHEPTISAFEQGSKAGLTGALIANPFILGSTEHHNYEIGRRHGARVILQADREPAFFHRLD